MGKRGQKYNIVAKNIYSVSFGKKEIMYISEAGFDLQIAFQGRPAS